jgi:hypothetical protein
MILRNDHQELTRGDGNRPKPRGHAHFWQRAAAMSRRNFLGAAGGAAAAGLAFPSLAHASSSTLPNPIPGGLDLFSLLGLPSGPIFHVYLPGTAPELSTITDFNGFIGQAEVLGTWSGGNVTVPPNSQFDADMRFMAGEYIGRDGKHHQGVFGFI